MKYKRILLKLSGESLAGEGGNGFDAEVLESYARQIAQAARDKVQVAIVVGGGNIYRGLQGFRKPSANLRLDRVVGDQMGMLATVVNSLALQSALIAAGARARVMTSFSMAPVGEIFAKPKAVEYLEAGDVVIVAGGTGNPYFTTDSASALRGVELEADVLLKGTRVDGVYDKDPEKFPDAVKFDALTMDEVYARGLRIMDLTAFTLCRENRLPILVFDMDTPGNLAKVLKGEQIGTIIK